MSLRKSQHRPAIDRCRDFDWRGESWRSEFHRTHSVRYSGADHRRVLSAGFDSSRGEPSAFAVERVLYGGRTTKATDAPGELPFSVLMPRF
jgi:hypothetical protein